MRRREALGLALGSLFGAAALPTRAFAARPQAAPPPVFDGEKAFALLKKQCEFGPRYLGSEGHEKAKAFLLAELGKHADAALTQDFKYRDLPGSNVVGIFHPKGEKTPDAQPILLLAHWDTRPVADGPRSTALDEGPAFRFGRDGWNRLAPVLGANDGASGVAVLLELARLFRERPPRCGVVILLVDGEDYGDFRAGPQGEGVLLGSRHFAQTFRDFRFRDTKPVGLPRWGILLDMVGAKELLLPVEQISRQAAPELTARVYKTAKELGHGGIFRANAEHEVTDDHVPLNAAGIPTLDLIHPLPFGRYERTGYAAWHTLQDTPERCSPASLRVVGETVAAVVYSEPAA